LFLEQAHRQVVISRGPVRGTSQGRAVSTCARSASQRVPSFHSVG